MTWNLQDFHFESKEIPRRRCFDREIGFDWFDFKLKTEVAKELAIRNHRRGRGVTADRATEASFDFGNILDVIDMSVREQQELEIDVARIDPLASAIRGVEENRTLRRLQKIAVRLENAAAEGLVSHPRRSGLPRN